MYNYFYNKLLGFHISDMFIYTGQCILITMSTLINKVNVTDVTIKSNLHLWLFAKLMVFINNYLKNKKQIYRKLNIDE